MGSSNRKKKEKAKDFQVSCRRFVTQGPESDMNTETQVEGRKDESQDLQLYRHKFPVEM